MQKRIWLLVFVAIILSVVIIVLSARKSEEVIFSSSGNWIVLSCGYYSTTNSESSLYIMRPDGSRFKRITPPQLEARNPAWSHNGEWIVFSTNNSGTPSIRMIRPDGSESRLITELDWNAQVDSIDWSDKKGLIAYATHDFDKGSIQVIDSANKTRTVSLIDGMYNSISWSPDGNSIAYTTKLGSNQIGVFVVDVETEVTSAISDNFSFSNLFWSNATDQISMATEMNEKVALLQFDGDTFSEINTYPLSIDFAPHTLLLVENSLLLTTMSKFDMSSYDLTSPTYGFHE